jgi:TonB family protein
MTNRQNDIERYLKGDMTPPERHALEKAALSDPFLADALAGAEQVGSDIFSVELMELQSSIYARTRKRNKPRTISLWNWSLGIAAGLIVIAVSGVFIIGRISEQQRQREMAVLDTQSQNELRLIRDSGEKDSLTIIIPQSSQRYATAYDTRSRRSPRRIAIQPRIETIAQSGVTQTVPQREVEVNLSEKPVIATEDLADSDVVSAKEKSDAVRSEVVAANDSIINVRSRVVKGKVISTEDGSTLPGVNVLVKGTREGTVTNEMGNFEIKVDDNDTDLVFSFIGMQTKEVAIKDKNQIDIKLDPDYAQLSEVVVTGSGVQSADHSSLKLAEPQGGRKAFQHYLEKELQYPKQALDNKVEGKVTVQFTVGLNGQLDDFKVIKGIGFGCDDEVIRLIKQGPAWVPTTKNDQPVSEKVKVRLKFELPD